MAFCGPGPRMLVLKVLRRVALRRRLFRGTVECWRLRAGCTNACLPLPRVVPPVHATEFNATECIVPSMGKSSPSCAEAYRELINAAGRSTTSR